MIFGGELHINWVAIFLLTRCRRRLSNLKTPHVTEYTEFANMNCAIPGGDVVGDSIPAAGYQVKV